MLRTVNAASLSIRRELATVGVNRTVVASYSRVLVRDLAVRDQSEGTVAIRAFARAPTA